MSDRRPLKDGTYDVVLINTELCVMYGKVTRKTEYMVVYSSNSDFEPGTKITTVEDVPVF